MRKSLKTHDKIKSWDLPDNIQLKSLMCVLCNQQADSHNYLFFECPYSCKVWNKIKVFADMSLVSNHWDIIVTFLQPMANRNVLCNIIGRLILGVSSYFIWQERNLRVHKKGRRSEEQLFGLIFNTVKQKIMTLRVRKTGEE